MPNNTPYKLARVHDTITSMPLQEQVKIMSEEFGLNLLFQNSMTVPVKIEPVEHFNSVEEWNQFINRYLYQLPVDRLNHLYTHLSPE